MNLRVSGNVQAHTRFMYDAFSKNNREKLRKKDIIEQESYIINPNDIDVNKTKNTSKKNKEFL